MTMKPKMSLSLDLDNKWSYLKTHGSEAWKGFPSYFDLVVPRILEFLDDRDIKITFFIVGQDAELEKNRDALGKLGAAGHEFGNHSFNHEPWLHLYSEADLDHELARAEAAIESATGAKVRGFRGPGFSISETTLRVLQKRGYDYDATAFPNVLNPLARAYFFATSNLSDEEKERRKALFGSFSDAFRPVKPYRWNLDGKSLLELPVTTMPIFKTPIHFSYLIYLASYSRIVARLYLRFAIAVCKLTRTEPSLLLHPLDFMGREDDSDLAFFPAMTMPLDRKLKLMDEFFELLLHNFEPVTMGQHVKAIVAERHLRQYVPTFAH
jgi:peptidoglycan/xylan/chitin deacetylase (PgdA/CDA1 family)